MTCTYPECDCAISFPDGYKPSEATECPRVPMDAGTSRPALPGATGAPTACGHGGTDMSGQDEKGLDELIQRHRESIVAWFDARFPDAVHIPHPDRATALPAGEAGTVGVKEGFTTGHCEERKKPGGCQLHNLYCAYPDCDRKPALTSPKEGKDALVEPVVWRVAGGRPEWSYYDERSAAARHERHSGNIAEPLYSADALAALRGELEAAKARDPICRKCASGEPGIPELCTCGDYPADALTALRGELEEVESECCQESGDACGPFISMERERDEWKTRAETAEARLAEIEAETKRSQFPILKSQGQTIDFALVAEHSEQARANHYQTVARLAERGGLGWCELHAVLHDRPWQKMDTNEAIIACRALEARYLAAIRKEPRND